MFAKKILQRTMDFFDKEAKVLFKKQNDDPSKVPVLEKEYYSEIVEILRENSLKKPYFNHFPWQTKIVFENLLLEAERLVKEKKVNEQLDLRFFSGDVELSFFDKAIEDKLVEIAKAGCVVKVVLASPPLGEKVDFWKRLNQKLEGKGFVKMLKDYNNDLSHLWVCGNSYRVEKPHEKFSGNCTSLTPERPARFAFNLLEDANHLRGYWNKNIEKVAVDIA